IVRRPWMPACRRHDDAKETAAAFPVRANTPSSSPRRKAGVQTNRAASLAAGRARHDDAKETAAAFPVRRQHTLVVTPA
ncbi:MAG TPA: hypothetical protein VMU42_17895, partial [Candidatus Sulfotelmatobacter sp.]|nr:hypothetical protein [Candidatus Sulfotelmatobacter sp.]